MPHWFRPHLSRLVNDYGMLAVLLLMCLYYSWATWRVRYPVGRDAARRVAEEIVDRQGEKAEVLVVAGTAKIERQFSDTLAALLGERGFRVIDIINDSPPKVAAAVRQLVEQGTHIDAVAGTKNCRRVLDRQKETLSALADTQIAVPESYQWPTFLTARNLLNVANQIVVIAVIAIGMTMVIITAGIDLSVGSLVALSAVVVAKLIVTSGAQQATNLELFWCSVAAVAMCAAVGAFSGLMITAFRIPPFIATLGMMQIASGLAFIIARGHSIYQLPNAFTWLGRGADLVVPIPVPLEIVWIAVPNAVVLMIALYVAAHFVMAKTSLGRYIYAVGGNRRAAQLSGIRTGRILLIAYVVSGAVAGLGGVIVASQLKAGAPTYGIMYELYVIAAVVVGGTSLAGGEGKIFGTLIGAFIIAVIRNGMNLTDVQPYTQKVVLGAVILGAVLLDMLKRQGWRLPTRLRLS